MLTAPLLLPAVSKPPLFTVNAPATRPSPGKLAAEATVTDPVPVPEFVPVWPFTKTVPALMAVVPV